MGSDAPAAVAGDDLVEASGPADGWDAALDALEAAAAQAQALALAGLAGEPTAPAPWAPGPENLGPLPARLAARAQQILDAQAEAAQLVAEASALSRRHLETVAALRPHLSGTPVYLDVEG